MAEAPPAPKRVRSYAWEHFDLIAPQKVKCRICAMELMYSSNTSSMLRHLRSRHPETGQAVAPAAAGPVPAPVTQQGNFIITSVKRHNIILS